MPTYTFRDKNTGEESTHIMTWDQRCEYLTINPELEQIIVSAPAQVTAWGKPSDAFRDKLKEIKKANPRSTINTF